MKTLKRIEHAAAALGLSIEWWDTWDVTGRVVRLGVPQTDWLDARGLLDWLATGKAHVNHA